MRVKVEEVAPEDMEDPQALEDPPSPPSEPPQLPSELGQQQEVAPGKVKVVPEEEERHLQEAGDGLEGWDLLYRRSRGGVGLLGGDLVALGGGRREQTGGKGQNRDPGGRRTPGVLRKEEEVTTGRIWHHVRA